MRAERSVHGSGDQPSPKATARLNGCTANLIPADGVLNALDYARTCTCSYQHQTSLALVHMPGASHIEAWTWRHGARPAPQGHGVNFGAPGRRVDDPGLIWHPEPGTFRRHPSWINDPGDAIDWVAASIREGEGTIDMTDLLEDVYTVRLHFAELDADVETGERVFDVLKTDQALDAKTHWHLYMMLLKAERGFQMIKGSLGLRPNFHQIEKRVEGHIFISILAHHLLRWIGYTLEQAEDTREWKTILRLLGTHSLVTTRLPLKDGRVRAVRKPSLPDAEQEQVHRKLGIDWKAGFKTLRTEVKATSSL